jgi:hypothetical protein
LLIALSRPVDLASLAEFSVATENLSSPASLKSSVKLCL